MVLASCGRKTRFDSENPEATAHYGRPVALVSTVHRATDFRLFEREARTLRAAGHRVVVLAPHHCDETLEGVRIEPLPMSRSRARGFVESPFLLRRIARRQARIYHIHDPELIPLAVLLRLMGRKVIYDVREDFPKDILGKPYIRPWLRPWLAAIFSPLERLAARAMTAVIAANRPIARRFPQSAVIHNYAIRTDVPPPARNGPGGPAFPPFVVYFGAITRPLGAFEMVKAVHHASRHAPVRLRLMGPFQDRSLEAELLKGRLSSRIDYRGIVHPRSVYSHYAGALAGLVLYHPYPNHVEATPTKLFECMASGVPLIASDFPLWRRMVYDQGCGLVVDPLSVPQIADAIIYLHEHPDEAKKMGQRGRELVEKKYNWESESKKLVHLYERLLGRKARRPSPPKDTEPERPAGYGAATFRCHEN
jgi:glycosyltransferase involved in cell wall biosynthesis